MAANFVRLVDAAVDGPAHRISSLPMSEVKAIADSQPEPVDDESIVRPARSFVAGNAPAATTAIEAKLSSLWRGVLERPRVGVDADFFELGGNSLVAVRPFARLEHEFGATLPF